MREEEALEKERLKNIEPVEDQETGYTKTEIENIAEKLRQNDEVLEEAVEYLDTPKIKERK